MAKRKPTPVGLRQGRITVLGDAPPHITQSGKPYRAIHVRCDCGIEKPILLDNLPRTFSCGCLNLEQKKRVRTELTGQRFGKLTVLHPDPNKGELNHKIIRNHFIVRCACGVEFSARTSALTSGNTTACNSCRGKKNIGRSSVSYQGQRFGKLLVLRDWGSARAYNGKPVTLSLCQCDCGEQTIVRNGNLVTGNTTGCLSCKPVGIRDTVENFLSDPDWANSPCVFYLATVNGEYLKPGIARDTAARAKGSEGFYGEYLFESPVLTRSEAWAIEQRILKETLTAKPDALPDRYDGWVGRTELRLKSTFEQAWYPRRFNELLEELAESDWITVAEG